MICMLKHSDDDDLNSEVTTSSHSWAIPKTLMTCCRRNRRKTRALLDDSKKSPKKPTQGSSKVAKHDHTLTLSATLCGMWGTEMGTGWQIKTHGVNSN